MFYVRKVVVLGFESLLAIRPMTAKSSFKQFYFSRDSQVLVVGYGHETGLSGGLATDNKHGNEPK